MIILCKPDNLFRNGKLDRAEVLSSIGVISRWKIMNGKADLSLARDSSSPSSEDSEGERRHVRSHGSIEMELRTWRPIPIADAGQS